MNKTDLTYRILNEVAGYYENSRNYVNENDENSKGNKIYRQTMGNPVSLNEVKIDDDAMERLRQIDEYIAQHPDWNFNNIAQDLAEFMVDNDIDIDTLSQFRNIYNAIDIYQISSEIENYNKTQSHDKYNEMMADWEDFSQENGFNYDEIDEQINRLFLKESSFQPIEQEPTNEDDILQKVIELYNDSDVEIEEVNEDHIELSLDPHNEGLYIIVDYDYKVLNYNVVNSTYDNPGYMDFESDIKGTRIKIVNYNTDEEYEFNDGDGLMLADRIAKDYKDMIDEKFIDGTSPDDYNDSFFDPDEKYDNR